jgi:hypothetical protein
VEAVMKNQTTKKVFAQKVFGVATRTMIAALVAIAGLSSACSKDSGSTVVGRADAAANVWAAANGIVLNGNMTDSVASQSDWQDAISGFVQGKYPPDYLGFVSTTASGGTGAYLGGRVELQTGVLNAAGSQVANIRTDSKLLVEIHDEYTDRLDASGQKVMPLWRAFTGASGNVQGNRAVIRFTDEYGTVTLDGTFSGQMFYGTFQYDNSRTYNNTGTTAAGTIGNFRLPTCQFFRCQ